MIFSILIWIFHIFPLFGQHLGVAYTSAPMICAHVIKLKPNTTSGATASELVYIEAREFDPLIYTLHAAEEVDRAAMLDAEADDRVIHPEIYHSICCSHVCHEEMLMVAMTRQLEQLNI